MQNLFSFFLNINFNNVILSVFKTGRVEAVGYSLYLCFAIASQKDAAAIPHAKKPANRRLICKYRLKVLIEIEQS
jgi:hypothetical protein